MAKRTSSNGADLEALIALVYEALKDVPGTIIKLNAKVPNKIGKSKGQIDILITTKVNGINLITAIECKDYGKRVGVDRIDSFKAKCDRLLGIDKRIIVSSSGFQKQSYEAAYQHGIGLYTLSEISVDNVKNWIDFKSIRRITLDSLRILELKVTSKDNQEIHISESESKCLLRINENDFFQLNKYVFNNEIQFVNGVVQTISEKHYLLDNNVNIYAQIKRSISALGLNDIFLNHENKWILLETIDYTVLHKYVIDSFEKVEANSYINMSDSISEVQVLTLTKDDNKLRVIKTHEPEYKVFLVNKDGNNEELIPYN